MKKISTLFVLVILTVISNAQFTANFENGLSNLTGNCWTLNQIEWTNTPGDVITGTGSLYSNPPVNGSSTRDFYTPALNITSTSLNVSFDYKLSSKISGNATRTIEIGLVNTANNFTSLQLITLDKNSPTGVQNFNNTFTVITGLRKLVIKIGGTTGDGNTRVILDNFSTNASPLYNNGTNCNTAPVAVNDTFNGITGISFYGNVMNNDNDANGETITASIVTTSPDGTVLLNSDGSFSFIPNVGFIGSITTFTYRVTDNGFSPMSSNDALVTINFVAPSTLPVHLVSFQGNINKQNKVTLNWKVADNETVGYFEIERSLNGSDFVPVATVFATEKNGTEEYTYAETVSSNEKVMYRLKMYDKQQDIDYSKILVFQKSGVNNNNTIKILGNPVNDKLTLSYTSSSTKNVDVKVYDLAGRLHLNQKVKSYEGSNLINLALTSTFKSGLYIVEINSGQERLTAKFVKQ